MNSGMNRGVWRNGELVLAFVLWFLVATGCGGNSGQTLGLPDGDSDHQADQDSTDQGEQGENDGDADTWEAEESSDADLDTGDADVDPRSDGDRDNEVATAGVITGQVVLVARAPFNDTSRLRITLAQTEKSATPDASGSFIFEDLAPGRYTLDIRYLGALNGSTEGSVYEPLSLPLVLKEEQAANLGRIVLSLGQGSLHGQVKLDDGLTPDGTLVRLVGSDASRETQVIGGTYRFEQVPVGTYSLKFQRDGYAPSAVQPSSARKAKPSCDLVIGIGFQGETVAAPAFGLSPTAVSLLPGFGQTFTTRGADWFVNGEAVTVNVAAGFAVSARSWFDGQATGDYKDFANHGFTFESLPEGRSIVHFQFKDPCGTESTVYTLNLIRDVLPPIILDATLNGGAATSKESTVSFALRAADDYAATMQIQMTLCEVAKSGAWSCNPALGDAPWREYATNQSITFNANVGTKGVRFRLRDLSENATDITERSFLFDNIPPQNISLTIGDGSGTIYSPRAQVMVAASDADVSAMKIGPESGLSGSPWQPLSYVFDYAFPAGDGLKTLFARFKDSAGNESREIQASVRLVTQGTLGGRVTLEGQTHHAGTTLAISGTGTASGVVLSAVTNDDGSFQVLAAPAGLYTLIATHSGFDAKSALPFTVTPGQTQLLPDLVLALSRGSLSGSAKLTGATEHSGISVHLLGTSYTATANADGEWLIVGIPVGHYTVTASKTNYSTASLTDIPVVANVTTPTSVMSLAPNPGSVSGAVLLENHTDHSGTTILLDGTGLSTVTATDGSFALGGVAGGSYTFSASHTGYDTKSSALFVVNAGQMRTLEAISLQVSRGAISGQALLSGQTNHAGILIEAVGTAYSTSTNAEGRYALSSLPIGSYAIRASKAGYQTATSPTVTVKAAQSSLAESLTLPANPGAIGGTVLKPGAADQAGTLITLNGTSYSGATTADGVFNIPDIPEGVYSVSASAEGYERYDYPLVVVKAGVTANLGNATLDRKKGKIHGQVSLEGRSDYSGVRVDLLGTTYFTTSDAVGSYDLQVPIGNYGGVGASFGNYETKHVLATITVTESGTANLSLISLHQLTNDLFGTVTLFGKSDSTGVKVELNGVLGEVTEGYQVALTTDNRAGTFSYLGVPLGPYYITYSHTAGWERLTRAVSISAGATLSLPAEQLRQRYIQINADTAYTTTKAVTLTLGASDCYRQMISNVSSFAGATWDTCTATRSWTLAGPSGTNVVYAKFKDSQMQESDVISDTIWLDDSAMISALSEDTNGATKKRGDVIHFAMNTGEPAGAATVDIAGYAAAIVLYDNGAHGDRNAADGIYEVDYAITRSQDVVNGVVTGSFTDQYGNVATPITAPGTITIGVSPLIRNIKVVPNSQNGTAQVSWETDENTSALLEWGPDTYYGHAEIDATFSMTKSFIIGTGALVPSTAYHFRITATDAAGNATIQPDMSFYLKPNPPEMVVAMPGDGRFDIRWEAPPQENVVGYNIYRSYIQGGPYTKLNTSGPYTHEALMYTDPEAHNDQTAYYAVTALDTHGNESERSIEVGGTPEANHGPTEICGALVGNQVWTTKGSPYILACNTLVEEDQLLAIGPGVSVLSEKAVKLVIRGKLVTLGTSANRVVFSSNSNSPVVGDWKGIIIYDSGDGMLDHASGQYHSGLIVYNTLFQYAGSSAIRTSSRSLLLSRVEVSFNSGLIAGGIYYDSYSSSVIVNSNISHNIGLYAEISTHAGGIYVGSGAEVSIVGSVISQNDAPPGICTYLCSGAGGIAISSADDQVPTNVSIINTEVVNNRNNGVALFSYKAAQLNVIFNASIIKDTLGIGVSCLYSVPEDLYIGQAEGAISAILYNTKIINSSTNSMTCEDVYHNYSRRIFIDLYNSELRDNDEEYNNCNSVIVGSTVFRQRNSKDSVVLRYTSLYWSILGGKLPSGGYISVAKNNVFWGNSFVSAINSDEHMLVAGISWGVSASLSNNYWGGELYSRNGRQRPERQYQHHLGLLRQHRLGPHRLQQLGALRLPDGAHYRPAVEQHLYARKARHLRGLWLRPGGRRGGGLCGMALLRSNANLLRKRQLTRLLHPLSLRRAAILPGRLLSGRGGVYVVPGRGLRVRPRSGFDPHHRQPARRNATHLARGP